LENPTVLDETGAWGNVVCDGNVGTPRNRKGGGGNPHPKGKRALDLSWSPKFRDQLVTFLVRYQIIPVMLADNLYFIPQSGTV